MHRSILSHQAFTQVTPSLIAILVGIAGATPAIANSPASLSSFKNPQPWQMAQTSTLSGSWRLANMTAGDLPTPMLPIGELTVEFSGDRISGSGGCNRFMGGYKVQDKNLSIGPLASTFKACESAIMTQESQYLAALQGAQRYEIDDQGNLTIYYQTEQGSGVLRFTTQTIRGLW